MKLDGISERKGSEISSVCLSDRVVRTLLFVNRFRLILISYFLL
jgi:hypothetical protein